MDDLKNVMSQAKRRIARRYIRGLESIDPEFARHILGAQREFFLAGKAFFDAEANHAQRAIDKIERRSGQ